MKIALTYINPWIAKPRTLALVVCGEGGLACDKEHQAGEGVSATSMLSPTKPWGRPPFWPVPFPIKAP